MPFSVQGWEVRRPALFKIDWYPLPACTLAAGLLPQKDGPVFRPTTGAYCVRVYRRFRRNYDDGSAQVGLAARRYVSPNAI